MKQLTSSQPLCYMLPNSDLVTALPYIDEQQPDLKNKIQYLIKSQEKNIEFDEAKYLKELQLPITPFINSEHFEKEVERVKKNNENKAEKKDKKIGSPFDQISISMLNKSGKLNEQDKEKFKKSIICYENNLLKEVNLEIYQKLAPYVQKQLISALDKKKQRLQKQIEKEKQAIEQVNKQRQYQQLEAKQREQTIRDRLQVMIHKQKRIS